MPLFIRLLYWGREQDCPIQSCQGQRVRDLCEMIVMSPKPGHLECATSRGVKPGYWPKGLPDRESGNPADLLSNSGKRTVLV
jgi:hypothetical protein